MTKSQIAAHAVKDLLAVEEKRAMERKGIASREYWRWRHGELKIKPQMRKGEAVEILGRKVGVAACTIGRAKRVQKQDPVLFQRILDGDLSIDIAMKRLGFYQRCGWRHGKKIKWSLNQALRRLNIAVERELYNYNKYGRHDGEYVAIGKWLEERGKRWNNVRTFDSVEIGACANLGGNRG
jgi:hypothetical protein